MRRWSTTIVKLIDRIIVDHPIADPQPFMGPVIDLPPPTISRSSCSA